MNEIDPKAAYKEKLAGRRFEIVVAEIGNPREQKTIVVSFEPHCASHLVGESSAWAESKQRVFAKLCDLEKGTCKMAGEYNPALGVALDCDWLIGHEHGCFGLRESDYEDGVFVPVSTLELDLRQRCYTPLFKVCSVEPLR